VTLERGDVVRKLFFNKFSIGLMSGALGAFFFDPQHGARRRNVGRDRVTAFFRRRAADAERRARYAAGVAEGAAYKAAKAAPGRPRAEKDFDDLTLARKVESIIFRDPDVPKGDIDVNAENGIVFLRGEAKTPEQINELVEQTTAVEGVKGVQNLLHLPNTPAPTREGRPTPAARAA
jgi:hypothetical protein